MLMPKRTKYRKPHRIYHEGKSKGNTSLHFGEYGLMAKEGAWITARQIEAARVAMTRYMKRGGKVFVNIFPHLSLTKKPLETIINIQSFKRFYNVVTYSSSPSRKGNDNNCKCCIIY